MGRGVSTKSIVHYTIFAIVVLLGYKFFVQDNGQRDNSIDPFRDDVVEHPRNIRPEVVKEEQIPELIQDGIKDTVEEVENEAEKGANQDEAGAANDHKSKAKMDVGDLPKDLQPQARDMGDLMNHKELRKSFGNKFFKDENAAAKKDVFHHDGVDWDLEEEMKKRRASFQKTVMSMEEKDDGEFKDMEEADDDFAFVTAGSHSTYPATIEFIYSVQYFFPKSRIGIFDIGLTSDEREFISSLCKTEVDSLWLQFWPEALYKIRHRVWRPLVLQLALAKYGHYIYLEPGRFVNRQNLRQYLQHSRKHGVTVAGRQLKYSSYVVTSPHMYSFLRVNERKLQRTPHFDFTLLILHGTAPVRNHFMRYLIACAMEDYCIAPPDSKASCDAHLANNKRYANCHRYDESAINLILNHWHGYKAEEFLVRDGITRYFDGRDMSKKVKICNKPKEEI
ncbi:uncharacterized protein LOC101848295 [Aplysia californica]|uniref:Uncharacterized protein LOC101848295 n=1 Tax=Aplysia californica TaxID=6500 RepID=A0ABM1A1K5_APLCA|nr:uncharacterized protein LOC101848295 [Aplysia californica]